jgi:hypothetical protein
LSAAPAEAVPAGALTTHRVFSAWWPLATSWLFMGLELPVIGAGMARLPDATVSLAAYGGVVFPLALLIESPIIMLLSASTALSKDWASYRRVTAYMWSAGLALTALHALIAFTPLFDSIASGLLGVPDAIVDPARLGFQILLPWTMSIAYRRTQQGVMIRFGGSRLVGMGTAVRLAANLLVIAIGLATHRWSGIVVGATAVAAGVVAEALYAAVAVRPWLRDHVRRAPPPAEPLTAARFWRFYLPLLVMPLIQFLLMPLMSAAMSRMPEAIPSLAVWPVLGGMVFALRSLGFALNEVVVAQLEAPHPVPALRRFTSALALATSAALLLAAATPLGAVWLGGVSALPPGLAALGGAALWLAWPMPALSTVHSWYQGALLHAHRTRGITESVAVMIVVSASVLAAGIAWQRAAGLHVACVAMVAGAAAQALWLRWRAIGEIRAIAARDVTG